MNLSFMTGPPAGASQGVPLGEAVAAGAPSHAASPFAMLLAILAGPQTEEQAGAQPPVAPQGQPALTLATNPELSQQPQAAVNPNASKLAPYAFASPAQIEANADPADDNVQVEAQIGAEIALPEQKPQSVVATPELPAGPPPVVFSGESADAVGEQSKVKQPVAAPLPNQRRADVPVGSAVPGAAAPAQPSELQSSTPSSLQSQPQSREAQPASQAPTEIAKADAAASAVVDPKLVVVAANNGQGPVAAPNKTENTALPQQAFGKKPAETVRPSGPAQDAARKADVALDVDAGDNCPASPAPTDVLKPAEPRITDMTVRAPEPVAAAPANAQRADPAAPRAAPAPPQNPAPQTQVAVPVEGLAIHIARVAKSGERKFEIRLDPPELGKVSVRLEVSREGVVTTHLTVERAETMDLLQRDARALERALGQAGLDQKSGGISFSLSDQNAHPQHEGRDAPRHAYPIASDELSADAPAQPGRFRSADSLLDIRI